MIQGTSLVERRRIARAKHRELASDAPRVNGFCVYPGAPLLARDQHGEWYPAVMAKVSENNTRIRVHFVGWNTRFDFSCSLDSSAIRPSSADVIIADGPHLVSLCQFLVLGRVSNI